MLIVESQLISSIVEIHVVGQYRSMNWEVRLPELIWGPLLHPIGTVFLFLFT